MTEEQIVEGDWEAWMENTGEVVLAIRADRLSFKSANMEYGILMNCQ